MVTCPARFSDLSQYAINELKHRVWNPIDIIKIVFRSPTIIDKRALRVDLTVLSSFFSSMSLQPVRVSFGSNSDWPCQVLRKICMGSSLSIHQLNEVKAHNYFPMECNPSKLASELSMWQLTTIIT